MFIRLSKKRLITGLCGILVATGVNTAESLSVELGTTPSETGAKKIMAAVVSKTGELTDLATGEVVILPCLEETTQVRGGEVFWRSTRNWKDDLGFRHIHYQQRFSFSDPLSGQLPDPYSFEGVPLAGGSLKLHYDNEGVLYFVSGAYFEEVRVPGDLDLRTPLDALSDAWQAIGNTDAHEVSDFLSLDMSIKEELLEFTKLKLVSSGDGKTFAFAWEAPALLADGQPLMAALDGATGALLHYWDPNPHWRPFPCGPRSIIGTGATADPQNGAIPDRTFLAATPSNATPGYTYEAHWPKSSGAPVHIRGYVGTTADACGWAVGDQNYELLPLPTVSQEPHYGVGTDQQIGGDAVWKTYLTMDFFDQLGWDGFDDQGTRAWVVVEANCPANKNGNATFIHLPSPLTTLGPGNSVVICPRQDTVGHPYHQDYSPAASLDVVAHEWGHGVVYETAWGYDDMSDGQLHEGWADVIGHAVEWRQEGPGSGAETADWNYDEDSGRTNGRQANLDDGEVVVIGGIYDPDDNPWSYHAHDPCSEDGPHYCGLRLAVAFWLAADGEIDDPDYAVYEHKNPVCQRAADPQNDPIPPEVDCDLNVTPLGHWDATRIFFQALTVYIDYTDDWGDFAEYVKRSALDVFGSAFPCDNADDEQDTVQDAFTAIGYPGLTPETRYCICCEE